MCDFKKGWLKAEQARRLLGVSRQRVDQLVERGQLDAVWTPYGWLIKAASAEARRAGSGTFVRRGPVPERCGKGHLLAGSNAHISPHNTHGRPALVCRTCRILRAREFDKRRRRATARRAMVMRSDRLHILPAEIEEWRLLHGMRPEWP